MKANVFLKTQTYKNVNFKLNKSLNLYELKTKNHTVYAPANAINLVVQTNITKHRYRK